MSPTGIGLLEQVTAGAIATLAANPLPDLPGHAADR